MLIPGSTFYRDRFFQYALKMISNNIDLVPIPILGHQQRVLHKFLRYPFFFSCITSQGFNYFSFNFMLMFTFQTLFLFLPLLVPVISWAGHTTLTRHVNSAFCYLVIFFSVFKLYQRNLFFYLELENAFFVVVLLFLLFIINAFFQIFEALKEHFCKKLKRKEKECMYLFVSFLITSFLDSLQLI